MRHYTEEDVLAEVESLGLSIVNPRLLKVITAMLNKPSFPPKVKADPAEDCVIHWAPGWTTYMRNVAS